MSASLQVPLQTFIADQACAQRVSFSEFTLLSGGAIQENWLAVAQVEGGPLAGELQVVIRIDAASGVAVSHGRVQEFALLTAAFAAGVTVPEPLWLCSDLTLIGRPFFVMRRVAGLAAGHVLVKDLQLAVDRPALTQRLGEELARIHSIRPGHPALGFLPLNDAAPAVHSVQRYRAFLDAHSGAYPALEWSLRWLERHAPPADLQVLCHRDFRTGNYMVDAQGLTAVLDWEFAGWSDPLEDIGWFCAQCWRFGREELEAGGVGTRDDFYHGYERVSGRVVPRDQVHYWEVMAHMNWAIIALQQAERHVSGEEESLLLALTGQLVPQLEYTLLQMTEKP